MHPYATLAYARTLAHAGDPLEVRPWRTHVIVRDWKGVARDAMGTYPLACLAEDADLGAGLAALREAGLVSVTLVADGLAGPSVEALCAAFPVARPFKTHYVVDPAAGPYAPSRHHRQELRRAARRGVEVGVIRLRDHLDAWVDLYDELAARHAIGGVQRFPRASFAALAECEGLTAVAAFADARIVSCHLWFASGNVVWSHLAASSADGYACGAAYVVYDHSIRHFADRVVNLGGAAGIGDDASDGLARFKSGFANRSLGVRLYGAVLDEPAYRKLCNGRGGDAVSYFPAYRAP